MLIVYGKNKTKQQFLKIEFEALKRTHIPATSSSINLLMTILLLCVGIKKLYFWIKTFNHHLKNSLKYGKI